MWVFLCVCGSHRLTSVLVSGKQSWCSPIRLGWLVRKPGSSCLYLPSTSYFYMGSEEIKLRASFCCTESTSCSHPILYQLSGGYPGVFLGLPQNDVLYCPIMDHSCIYSNEGTRGLHRIPWDYETADYLSSCSKFASPRSLEITVTNNLSHLGSKIWSFSFLHDLESL